MLEAIKAWSGFVLVLIFLSIILSTLFQWLGTKVTNYENFNLKKIILIALTTTIVVYITTIILSAFTSIGTILCYILGLVLSLLIIHLFTNLIFQQSLIIWIFNIAAQILAVIIGAKMFIGGIKDLIKII
jgi:hypothetical protein